MRFLLLALLLVVCTFAPASVTDTSHETDDGGFVVCHEAIVAAPASEVWKAVSTSEGWMSWAVPFANIDFRLNGTIETSYNPEAQPGDPANIVHRILAYLPGRMMAFQVERPPPGFSHADAIRDLFSVVEIEPVDDHTTRVRLSGVGYTDSPAHTAMRDYFRQVNGVVLERLVAMYPESDDDAPQTQDESAIADEPSNEETPP